MASVTYEFDWTNYIINPDAEITEMCLGEHPTNGDPALIVRYENLDKTTDTYCFPLTNAHDIVFANSYLRNLNTGIDIKFESYWQYGQLIDDCFKMYKVAKNEEMKNLLRIISEQIITSKEICDHLNIIRLSSDGDPTVGILNAYAYGVMQGKRVERAKKKATA